MTTTFTDYLQTVRSADARKPLKRRRTLLPTWDEWLTFALVAIVFLSVVNSIESAEWVPGMPSLLLPSLAAMATGFVIGRTRLHEIFAHLAALVAGFGIITLQLIEFSRGETLPRCPRCGKDVFWLFLRGTLLPKPASPASKAPLAVDAARPPPPAKRRTTEG